MNGKTETLTARERQNLADLYDALLGAVCENGEDFFDGYHRRRGICKLIIADSFSAAPLCENAEITK